MATYQTCPHRRAKLFTVGDATIHGCALHQYCSMDIDESRGQTSACQTCHDFGARLLPKVDVVVTSHNYGKYLDEALDSVAIQSTRVLGAVIVVDDASGPDDQTKAICERRGVQYVRTEFKSPHQARGAGFALCRSQLVQFLDADNRMAEGYLLKAAEMFADDARLAIVYPDLQRFGESDKLTVMAEATRDGLERGNFVDTGAVWRTEAIRQIQPFGFNPVGHEDWRLAREVMRAGAWSATKHPIPLQYRIHGEQMSGRRLGKPYFFLAGLPDETVTVFTTFSARVQKSPELWERRKAWLREQTWPRIRLVVANTSHQPLPDDWMDGLPKLAGLSTYDHPVGESGLEDVNRAGAREVENNVQTAVAQIYNRMFREVSTEFVLVLEDDVFPGPLDTIEQLMRGFDPTVCAVSGVFRQRYAPYGITAWQMMPGNGVPPLLTVPGTGIQPIMGCGFGVLLLRTSQTKDEVLTGNTLVSRYYDADWFARLQKRGRRVMLNWNVTADHVGEHFPPIAAEPVGDKLHEILTECGIRRPVCGECAQWRQRMNAWGVTGCEEHRAEILARLTVEASKSSWLEAAGVAARGYFTTAAILDEAIKRAGSQSAAA